MDTAEFCEHVRSRCLRGKPLQGAIFREKQMVVCPTWEEKEKLAGMGVFPIHADELELMVTNKLAEDEKNFIGDLMLKYPSTRYLGTS